MGGIVDQVVATALLLICVSAITDRCNMQVSKQLVPFFIGLTVLGIGICFGFNCGYAINPARDLAPRLFTGEH
jgi:glycerol uptake facilitator-like aquaporin